MSKSDFKILVQGPEAEETAGELAELIKKEFGHEPGMEKGTAAEPGPGKKVDPNLIAAGASLAAVILSIPASLLTVRDLLSRPKKKKQIDMIIQWDKDRHGNNPGVNISISPPEGVSVNLRMAETSAIMDAAAKVDKG